MRAIGLAALLPLAGCAALLQLDRPRPEVAMEQGLEAYEQGDFQAAYEQVSWVYANFWHRPIGERALLTLTAIELDPRNPGRRLGDGAAMASWHPELPTTPQWSVPVSRTLNGLALEITSAHEQIARLEADRDRADRERVAAEREAERARSEAQQARAEAQRAGREAAAARQEAQRAVAAARARPPAAAPPAPAPAPSGDVAAIRAERDRLAREVQQLRSSLASMEQELERVRQTITRP